MIRIKIRYSGRCLYAPSCRLGTSVPFYLVFTSSALGGVKSLIMEGHSVDLAEFAVRSHFEKTK